MRLVIVLLLLVTIFKESSLAKPTNKPRCVTSCSKPLVCPFPRPQRADQESSSGSGSSETSTDGSSDGDDSESESSSTDGTSTASSVSSSSSSPSEDSSDESSGSSEESEGCCDSSCSSSEEDSESDESSEEDSDGGHQNFRSQRLSDHGEDVESDPLTGSGNVFKDFEEFEGSLNRPLNYNDIIHKGAFNRERAKIIETSLNTNFPPIAESVRKWMSTGNTAVGLGTSSMVLIRLVDESLQISYKDMLADDADLFEWWDGEENALNIGIIVARDARVDWYQLVDETDLLQIWSWSMIDPINDVKLFKFDSKWKLIVVSEPHNEYNGGSKITTLYGMDFLQNWWLEQTLFGDSRPIVTRDARYIITFSNILEMVFVYQYSDRLGRYLLHQNISDSTTINDIATFDIGYICFIAVASDNSAIYRIHDDALVPCQVENFYLDHVETWLPMPVDYLRDDALVLFQQKLNHFSHTSTIIEALVWNGETFEVLEKAPCYANGEEHYGLSCISLETSERGLKGATVVTVEEGTSHLISSKIFNIKTEVVSVPNPAEERTEHISNTIKMLHEKYREQEIEINNLQNIINSEPSVTGIHWHIKELKVPFVHFDGSLDDFLLQNSKFQMDGNLLSEKYLEETISLYKNILQKHSVRIKDAISHLKGAVKKTDFNVLESPLIVNGKFRVRGELNIKNAHVERINNINVDAMLERAESLQKESRSDVLELDYLNVEHVIVDGYVNSLKIPKADSNDPIILNRDLQLDKPVFILENVSIQPNGVFNNISLKNDVFTAAGAFNDLSNVTFENIKIANSLKVNGTVKCKNDTEFESAFGENTISHSRMTLLHNDTVSLDSLSASNIEVNIVNGISWDSFIRNVVYTNKPNTIDNLEVDGDVVSSSSLNLKYLNGIPFPDEYVLRNVSRAIHITGNKSFLNEIEASGVDAVGEINGINPDRIVTLSTRQELGDMMFADLSVMGKMDIKEKISIDSVETFVKNPTLLETSKVKSNVIFQDITVQGKVFVSDGSAGSQWNVL